MNEIEERIALLKENVAALNARLALHRKEYADLFAMRNVKRAELTEAIEQQAERERSAA